MHINLQTEMPKIPYGTDQQHRCVVNVASALLNICYGQKIFVGLQFGCYQILPVSIIFFLPEKISK